MKNPLLDKDYLEFPEISESYKDKDGILCRKINGIEIKQIEEKTKQDAEINKLLNLERAGYIN
jgi:predicted unusual protein kinase regulating ubiquinone biosynthesis (AarF/ABC1/UbiB family)